MQRRILAAVAAFVLAAVGAVLLIDYVGGADDRARADEETIEILVAQADIPIGTPANQLAAKVKLEPVPERLLRGREDAISDLAELGERRTATAMLQGDYLSEARFSEATAKTRDDGREQLSLTLDAQRAVGGNLSDGDRVAVYRTSTTPDGARTTERLYDDIPVTRVTELDSSAVAGGAVTVTLALDEVEAATVIAGMHDGSIWLSLVDAATSSKED
ncbi:RcpC/CpaB family pilus assembly protein [Blastococcus sp. CCUG 61487]|uniref:Flp pilus assembly protein CpaB n=1 Tax=Blastococcus sp. CCUG 61487 TaxID=1840703 RepID=UPI0010BFD756|nr:RcpC/CpaB family pilus assembly protein [Blastococcus sp. CCUG 61487]TKJ20647.1 hypothetical protein A6V29_08350 [Blastococcus sp. CCUG 61487]